MDMTLPNRFNVRVYGILLNQKKEVLVMDEKRFGIKMTKFPGGGLEFGEGLSDALKREWTEELNLDIEVLELFYINDFFQPSAFRKTDQLISIYYLVRPLAEIDKLTSEVPFNFSETAEEAHSVRLIPIEKLRQDDFTFPVDQAVAERLKLLFQ